MAQVQIGTSPEERQIIETINAYRSNTSGVPALTQTGTYNQLALTLAQQTFNNDCSFQAGSDQSLAQQLGIVDEIEVIRACGVDMTVERAINLFTAATSTTSGQPLIAESRFTLVGIAYTQIQTAGNPQSRFVLVLGVGTPPAASPPDSVEVASVSLTGQYTATDLGFSLVYPEGWTVDTSSSLTILADAADLLAATDGDPATRAAQPFISLDALPLPALGLAPDSRLDAAAEIVKGVLGFTAQDVFEVPILARRSMTFFGSDSHGDYGLVTFWRQGDNLILYVFSAATAEEVQSWSSTWKQMLVGITPLNALPLSESFKSRFTNITISYPAGWTIFDGTDRLGIFEKSSDRDLWIAGQDSFMEAIAITVLYQDVKELVAAGVLRSENDLDELLNLNTVFLGWHEPKISEAILFGQPAYIVETANTGGFYVYAVMGFVEGHVYLIHSAAPDPIAVQLFKPTFDWMMMNFRRE
jgi:hypothetical protein